MGQDSQSLKLSREHGFLTSGDREFLINSKDGADSASRQRRYRIREKLKGVLRDFFHVRSLRASDIEQALSDVSYITVGEEPPSDVPSGPGVPASLLYFLYSGFSKHEFRDLLERGVKQAIVENELEENGVYPEVSVEFSVKSSESVDIGWLEETLKAGDASAVPDWFGVDDWEALVQSGKVSNLPEDKVGKLREKAEYEARAEAKAKQAEKIRSASYESLRDMELIGTLPPDLQELIEERKQYLAKQISEGPAGGGLSLSQIDLLAEMGELEDSEAKRWRDRYRYIQHCWYCAEGIRFCRESTMHPQFFDPHWTEAEELEEWHNKKAQSAKIAVVNHGSRSPKHYECILMEDEMTTTELEEQVSEDFYEMNTSPSLISRDEARAKIPAYTKESF